jgi:DNA-binding IclR family transcriptional regulator
MTQPILEEFDEILITGTAFSPQADFVALRCLVAVICDDGTSCRGGLAVVWTCQY